MSTRSETEISVQAKVIEMATGLPPSQAIWLSERFRSSFPNGGAYRRFVAAAGDQTMAQVMRAFLAHIGPDAVAHGGNQAAEVEAESPQPDNYPIPEGALHG